MNENQTESLETMKTPWILRSAIAKCERIITFLLAKLFCFCKQIGVANLSVWSYLPPLTLSVTGFYWYSGYSNIFLDLFYTCVLLACVAVILLHVQDFLLYYPTQPKDARSLVPRPEQFKLPSENLTIHTRDGFQLHAFLIKHENSRDHSTVIMFHGNAGNIGHRLQNAARFYYDCNMNVLLMEYRGYGRSGGCISEQGLYEDAISTINYIQTRKDLNPNTIVLHGRSLGGAVAIYAASCPENAGIQALLLENTFTSLPDIAKCVLNVAIIKCIPVWCYKNLYSSKSRIGHIRQPTLFLSGRADTLVPPFMMDELHQASGSHIRIAAHFAEGTHNETWTEPGYFDAVNAFMARLA